MATVNQLKLNDALKGMDLKQVGDGARQTKFDVQLVLQGSRNEGVLSEWFNVLVKTASLPSLKSDVVEMKYRGQTIPLAGRVHYDNTWSCTMYLQNDHQLKMHLENWMIDMQTNHVSRSKDSIVSGYKTISIFQRDFQDSQSIVRYDLMHVFPKSISAVELDYSQQGNLLEVTVEFGYQYYDIELMDKSQMDSGQFLDRLFGAGEKINDAVKGQAGLQDIFTDGKASEALNSVKSKISKSNPFKKSSSVDPESDLASMDSMVP